MNAFLDPNIAYLMLALGLVVATLAAVAPGTGILEIIALFALVLAGIQVYYLPVNWWALLILLVGAVLFVISLRRPKQLIYLVVAIAALVAGSAFLFRSEELWVPAVNPGLAAVVSIVSGGFFWIAARKYMEASQMIPTHDLGPLIGKMGEARTSIHDEGSVQVGSELWSARSEQPIQEGAQVRVVSRDGFTLIVEALPTPEEQKD